MIKLFAGVFMAMVLHEGGHYLAALFFGHKINFRFAWGFLWKIPIPRGVWTMPQIERQKQRIIALAGFGMEFAFIPIFYLFVPEFGAWYAVVAVIHAVMYRFYADEASDFNWI